MTQPPLRRRDRGAFRSLAFYAPSVCAAIFSFASSHESVGNRIAAALGMAIAVPFAAFLGYVLCVTLAATLLGETDVESVLSGVSAPNALAGLFLFTFLWIWWQRDKEAVVRDIAQCASDRIQAGERVDGATISVCYGERGSSDSDDE